MKFNFRKIASALASTAIVGSTVALAAAASWPAPFVKNGAADVAIVYGNTPDLTTVTDITTALSSHVTSSGGSSGVPEGGDFVQLEKNTDKFNLGNTASTFFPSIDDDELSTILAYGIYENDDNDEYDFTQEIKLGALTLSHFQDNEFNDDEPIIGFDLPDSTHILNYTLDFSPDALDAGDDWESIETTTLTMLGKEWYVLSATNVTSTITLLDSAADAILTEGETITLTAGGKTYQASIEFIGSDEVILNINGVRTNSLSEGTTQKLSDGSYVGIKDILVQDYAGGVKRVDFSIGSGKIELRDGEEVKLNNEDLSDLDDATSTITSYITSTGDEIDKIVLSWDLEEDQWVAPGSELTMPGFNAIKFYMSGFVTPMEEETMITPDSDDKFKISTEVTDGSVDFNFLYTNSSGGFGGIGKDSDETLVTNGTANSMISFDVDSASWFVATWISGDDHESYVLEVSEINDNVPEKNVTTIKSVATGGNAEGLSLDIGETDEIGQISFTLLSANEGTGVAQIALSAAGGTGTVYTDKLVTAGGMKIQLPYNASAALGVSPTGDGAIFLGNSSNGAETTFVMNVTEETKDGDVNEGLSFAINLGFNGDSETNVASVVESAFSGADSFETTDSSDDFVGYMSSDLATRVLLKTGGDQDSVEITYHGEEAYGEVFISELGVTTGSTGSLGNIAVMDDELASSGMQAKNLIVVGGSCINTAAQTLLGLTEAACGSAWTSATGAGAGEWVIRTYDNPWDTGSKIATLVAGYDQSDTAAAANALKTQSTIDITSGKNYMGGVANAQVPVLQ